MTTRTRSTRSPAPALVLAASMMLPALALARPPDDIARHRATFEALSSKPDARTVSRELGQMRSWIDAANTQWRRGDRDGLELTLIRLEAQAELVRARMQAAKARAELKATEDGLTTVQHQIEAERARYEAMRSFLAGEE